MGVKTLVGAEITADLDYRLRKLEALLTCHRCAGTGCVTLFEKLRTCPHCGGTGDKYDKIKQLIDDL